MPVLHKVPGIELDATCAAKDRAKQALMAAQAATKRGRALTPCIPAGKGDPGTKKRRHSDPNAAAGAPGETPPLVRNMACDAKQRGPQTDLQGAKGKKKQLSQFEAAFAGVVENADFKDQDENSQRLQNLATTMEWSMIESECKQLAAQEAIEERMEAATEMKVSAHHCVDCGIFSEARRPGCSGHEVKQVQVTKRWFKCGSCGHRTSSVARRFPEWSCDRCRMQDWQSCSMYIVPKDKVAEMRNQMSGYADSAHLKISGSDFDTRL